MLFATKMEKRPSQSNRALFILEPEREHQHKLGAHFCAHAPICWCSRNGFSVQYFAYVCTIFAVLRTRCAWNICVNVLNAVWKKWMKEKIERWKERKRELYKQMHCFKCRFGTSSGGLLQLFFIVIIKRRRWWWHIF